MPLTETGVGLLDSGPPHWRELDGLLQRYYAMRLKATLVLMELHARKYIPGFGPLMRWFCLATLSANECVS